MHSIKLNDMIGYSILLLVLLLPLNIHSYVYLKTACELLKLPRDCHCQRTRGVPVTSLNETRLRCRQFTKLTTDYRWSIVPYDRLAFETPNDNLTLDRFAFADIRARTIRFDVQNLFLNDHAFDNAYIGQLAISRTDNYGTIQFQPNGQVFYGTTVTNIFIKSIDFQRPFSEIAFVNAKIYTFIIQSSKFYGFTNNKLPLNPIDDTRSINESQYINFLEYDFMSTTSSSLPTSSPNSPLKIRRMKKKTKFSRELFDLNDDDNSVHLPDETVTINITSIHLPAFITIYTIISSINTSNFTEYFFPNNIEYSQTDQIELIDNYIYSLDAHAFRHLQFFEGRLILTSNHIHFISPHAFIDLYSLNNLSLANNNIRNLSVEHFQSFQQLIELDLSFNSIESLFNYTFQSLVNLRILRLNHNPLKYLDSHVFTNLHRLEQIHLQGINFLPLIDSQSSHWIWNLASLHVNYLLNTNFDLSDVAFCLLSRFNETLSHLPRQHSCSCPVHYLYRNLTNSYSSMKYSTNYLRLTPLCLLNETLEQTSMPENSSLSNQTEFLLQGLEDQCDYKLIFLDCDAMTTTTTTTTTITSPTTESTTVEETTITETTTERPVPTTTLWYFKYTKAPKRSVNNAKKLFTVLGTLIAITIAAIIFVILWYRLKAIFKRRQKQKKLLEQQKHFNSPSNNNLHSTAPRYASSDMLSSLPSAQLSGNKSQSQALIAASASPTATVYKNVDALTNDSIQNYIDDESLRNQPSSSLPDDDQQTIDIEANTQC